MADKPIKFQRKTVQAVRGTESLSINKWQKQGWELVDQTPGKLRTTLHFRKPASKARWLAPLALLGLIALVFGGVGIASIIDDDEDGADDVEIARVRFVPLMPGVPREEDPGPVVG